MSMSTSTSSDLSRHSNSSDENVDIHMMDENNKNGNAPTSTGTDTDTDSMSTGTRSASSSTCGSTNYSKKMEMIMEDDFHKFSSIILSLQSHEMLESDAIVQLAHLIRRKVDDVILGLNAYLSDGYEIVKVKRKKNKFDMNIGIGQEFGHERHEEFGRHENDEDGYQLFYRIPMDDHLIPLLASDVWMHRVVNQLKEYKMLLKRRNHQSSSSSSSTRTSTNSSHSHQQRQGRSSPSKNMSWNDPAFAAYGKRHYGRDTPTKSCSVRQYESSTRAQREQRKYHLKPGPTRHTSKHKNAAPKDANLQLSKIRDIMDTMRKSNDANVECKICLQPMRDAYVSPDCLHRFCGKCFKKSVRQCGSECPLCRTHLSSKRALRQDKDYDVLVETFHKIANVIRSDAIGGGRCNNSHEKMEKSEMSFRKDTATREEMMREEFPFDHGGDENDDDDDGHIDTPLIDQKKRPSVNDRGSAATVTTVVAKEEPSIEIIRRERFNEVFEENMKELRMFKLKHGHVNVKQRDNPRLYKILYQYRRSIAYAGLKEGVRTLNQYQIQTLKDLGVEFFQNDSESSSSTSIPMSSPMIASRGSSGSVSVSVSSGTCSDEIVAKAHEHKQSEKVTRNINQKIEQLRQFKQKHGHVNVRWKDNHPLALFCYHVRKGGSSGSPRKNNALTPDQFQSLRDLGFDFDNGKIQSSQSMAEDVHVVVKEKIQSPQRMTKNAQVFEQRVDQLRAYKRKHGHVNVRWKDDESLYHACYHYRKLVTHPGYRGQQSLNEYQIQSLRDLGFDFNMDTKPNSKSSGGEVCVHSNVDRSAAAHESNDENLDRGEFTATCTDTAKGAERCYGKFNENAFYEKVEQLRDYKRTHGNVNVMQKHDMSLYKYCLKLKKSMAEKSLSDEKIKALNDIGFDFSISSGRASAAFVATRDALNRKRGRDFFRKNVDKLRAFRQKHGHFIVKEKQDSSLCKFRKNVTKAMAENSLTEEQNQMLKEIGFNCNTEIDLSSPSTSSPTSGMMVNLDESVGISETSLETSAIGQTKASRVDTEVKPGGEQGQIQHPKVGDLIRVLYDQKGMFSGVTEELWTIARVMNVARGNDKYLLDIQYPDNSDDQVDYPHPDIERIGNVNSSTVFQTIDGSCPGSFACDKNPASLVVGDHVECLHQNGKFEGRWWSGRIASASTDGERVDVAYFDGEYEMNVPLRRGVIHLIGRGALDANKWLVGAEFTEEAGCDVIDEDCTTSSSNKKSKVLRVYMKRGQDYIDSWSMDDIDDLYCAVERANGSHEDVLYSDIMRTLFTWRKKHASNSSVWPDTDAIAPTKLRKLRMHDKAFETKLKELQEFKMKHGHIKVSKRRDKPLYLWCYRIKQSLREYSLGTHSSKWPSMTPTRVRRLEDIGFEVKHVCNSIRSRTGVFSNEESFESNNTTCANNHQQDQDADSDADADADTDGETKE